MPNLLVPDNTKVAVIKACLYEPQVNHTYADMAAHYDTAILPAWLRRPRDKAKVEAAVLIIERWLLGRLRHRRFYSLAELNAAISELLRQLNEERPVGRLGVTRRALLEELASQGIAQRALFLRRMAAPPRRHRLPVRRRFFRTRTEIGGLREPALSLKVRIASVATVSAIALAVGFLIVAAMVFIWFGIDIVNIDRDATRHAAANALPNRGRVAAGSDDGDRSHLRDVNEVALRIGGHRVRIR